MAYQYLFHPQSSRDLPADRARQQVTIAHSAGQEQHALMLMMNITGLAGAILAALVSRKAKAVNNAKQIVAYLEALARELADQGGRVQYHILVTGGAWMLLQKERRSTHDIDFALIVPPRKARPHEVISIAVQRGGEIATRTSNTVFSQAVEAVAAEYGLPVDWLNDECAGYLYDSAPGAEAYLWRSFSQVLYVYLPTDAYIFTLKLIAYRRQDRPDLQVLRQRLRIHTPEEAQAVLDRFVPESEQVFWEVEKKLKRLFR